jgi:hypothetical protein
MAPPLKNGLEFESDGWRSELDGHRSRGEVSAAFKTYLFPVPRPMLTSAH